jgi:hypothetical protein
MMGAIMSLKVARFIAHRAAAFNANSMSLPIFALNPQNFTFHSVRTVFSFFVSLPDNFQ